MKPTGLSAYRENLLDKPSVPGTFCAVCGDWATDAHHVVQKGMGGVSKDVERRIPTIRLCRRCHSEAHAKRLHFQWDGEWLFFHCPDPMPDEKAWEEHRDRYVRLQGRGES